MITFSYQWLILDHKDAFKWQVLNVMNGKWMVKTKYKLPLKVYVGNCRHNLQNYYPILRFIANAMFKRAVQIKIHAVTGIYPQN